MFTHADFNRRGHTIAYAMIGIWGESGTTFARLFRFQSGDCAWWARGRFIAWPHRVHICNRIGHGMRVPTYLREYSSPLPGAL